MRKSLSCKRNPFLEICVVLQCVGVVCEISVTQGYSRNTQGKLRKEIGGKEGRGKAYELSILSMISSEGLY